jgi:hypothetical protein
MRLIICALVLLSAAPAWAQQTPSTSPAAAAQDAPDPLVAARASVAQAHADDLFTLSPDGERVSIRHNRSRLVCHAASSQSPDIDIYPERGGGPPRGDDVSCGGTSGGITATFYATRYAQAVSVDDALAESVYEITQVSPQAQEYESVVARDPLQPIDSRTQSFIIPSFMHRPGIVYSRTSVAVIDGWVYLMRVTGPQGAATEQAAEDAWRAFETDLAAAATPAH